ncbi:hypothetical protein [Lentilactobacillus hilgardii]|uniref:Uncharacterized protein n=1 Tax=Lentilactobacillus hilgardii TaxID=1588 RepID=A0A6P1E228_LENHI|nr:hypothetical protein [Lentilactobacillus hilgardii]EEI71789.1 hypothetical protein HMPREF0496_0979 [Lentilactobacillus hilgardii ATCC 27305]MCT3393098.1 hypothetical protein [Lentilactobacillus hilgardii]QHB51366.1 hypothetical protein GQR93_03610 [Lentilactobacillus hilgardii]RRG10332.1 MAG: hypothetical protein DUD35_07970 [Lactobacillus sp.]
MEMKKFAVGIAVVPFIGIGLLSNPQQSNAATWHRGTPRILRGNYARKQSAYPQFETLKFYSNKVVYQGQGNPQLIMQNVKYKKVRNAYILHGFVKVAIGIRPGRVTWKFYHYSHKLASKSFDGHATWYYKNVKA